MDANLSMILEFNPVVLGAGIPPVAGNCGARLDRREDQRAVLGDGEIRCASILRAKDAVDDRRGPATDRKSPGVERDRVQLALLDAHGVIDQASTW